MHSSAHDANNSVAAACSQDGCYSQRYNLLAVSAGARLYNSAITDLLVQIAISLCKKRAQLCIAVDSRQLRAMALWAFGGESELSSNCH
jgi:hypothetical protein